MYFIICDYTHAGPHTHLCPWHWKCRILGLPHGFRHVAHAPSHMSYLGFRRIGLSHFSCKLPIKTLIWRTMPSRPKKIQNMEVIHIATGMFLLKIPLFRHVEVMQGRETRHGDWNPGQDTCFPGFFPLQHTTCAPCDTTTFLNCTPVPLEWEFDSGDSGW